MHLRPQIGLVCLAGALACTQPRGGDAVESDSESEESEADGRSFIPPEVDMALTPVDSHEEDIQPIWSANCVVYCHGDNLDGPAGGLSLEIGEAYEAMVGVQSVQVDMVMVDPGQLETSYVWHKLVGSHVGVGGEGVQMPKDAPPLSELEQERVETWILAGAPP